MGISWTPIGAGLQGLELGVICITGKSLFISTSNGIYRSSDTGLTWFRSDSVSANCIVAYSSTVVAGTGNGIRRSTDDGASWNVSNEGLTSYDPSILLEDGGILYAQTDRFFRSSDAGETWVAIDSSFFQFGASAFAADDSELIVTPYDGVLRSTDSGTTWQSTGWIPGNGCNPIALLISEGRMFAGTACGISRSTDDGADWDTVLTFGQGFENGVINFVSNDSIVVALEWDAMSLLISTDFGVSWTGSSAAQQVSAFKMDGSFLLISSESSHPGIYGSRDDGVTWDSIANWTPPNQLNDPYSLAVRGPLIFAGSLWSGVHVSQDSGVSWTQAGSNLGSMPIYPATMSESNLFAYGADGRIYKTALAQLSVYTPTVSMGKLTLFPNPTSLTTIINYNLSINTPVSITIIDPLGRIIANPIRAEFQEAVSTKFNSMQAIWRRGFISVVSRQVE